MNCETVRDEAAEYVLGTLDGAERAAVVAHLTTCDICRAEVASLAGVTDALWLAVPGAEPAAGFEDRVLRALRPKRRPWRVALPVAAALLLVLAGFVAGASRPERAVAAGAMVDRSRAVVGHATVVGGSAPYVHVTVDAWGHDGEYLVEVVRKDGTFARVSVIRIAGGRGAAGGPLPVPYGDVRAVWVTDAAHEDWCAFRVTSEA